MSLARHTLAGLVLLADVAPGEVALFCTLQAIRYEFHRFHVHRKAAPIVRDEGAEAVHGLL